MIDLKVPPSEDVIWLVWWEDAFEVKFEKVFAQTAFKAHKKVKLAPEFSRCNFMFCCKGCPDCVGIV